MTRRFSRDEQGGLTPYGLASALGGDPFGGLPETIERRERVATERVVNSDRLPAGALKYREQLERLGFTFGGRCGPNSTDGDGQPMYVEARLPEGWRKGAEPSDPYGRGSYLFDPAGNKRASIFVKEAGYDNYCSISFARRYQVEELQCNSAGEVIGYGKGATHVRYALTDRGQVLDLVGELLPEPDWRKDRAEAELRTALQEKVKALAVARLSRLHPACADPFAYWDDTAAPRPRTA